MREVKFSLHHDDCHWCTATGKFQDVSIKEVSWNAVKNGLNKVTCHGLYEIQAKARNVLDATLDELKTDSRLHLEITGIGAQRALVYSRWKSVKSPSDAIRAHNCIHLGNVTIENGFENYCIVTPDENPVGEVLDSIEAMGCVNIKKVGKYEPEKLDPNALTPLQKEALAFALEHGYYQCPKNVKLDELAKAKKKSRAAFQKVLRKAEAKIMPTAIKDALVC